MAAVALQARQSRVTDDNHGPYVTIVTALIMVWMLGAYFIRISIRYTFNGPFGRDDHVLTAATLLGLAQGAVVFIQVHLGLGKPGDTLSASDAQQVQKAIYAGDILWIVTIALSQISAFLLLGRLTRIPYHQIALNALSGITGLWAVASIFVIALRCDLVHPWLIQDTSCGPSLETRWMVVGALGAVVELAILVFPIALVWELQMKMSAKVVVVMAFSLRLPVLAILVTRLYFLDQALHGSDYIFELATPITLAEIQLFYSLIAATIPCLRPFLKAFNSGFLGVAATQTDPTLYGSSGGRKGDSSYILQSRRGDNKSAIRSAARPSRHEGKGFREVNIGQSHTCVEHDPMHNAETGSRTSDGSEKMIIRQTVAWDVQYEESNANTSTKDVNMAESHVVEN